MNNLLPDKCLVDTNVPLFANRALSDEEITETELTCIENCILAIEHVIQAHDLVLDDGDLIFDEYRHKLSLRGAPGIGDRFLKWVHDRRYSFPEGNRVPITATEDSFEEFPDHPGLVDFDLSDRKFLAVANAHPEKPPILQASDSKWWGWRTSMRDAGLEVVFLCEEYISAKYRDKFPE